MMMVLQERTRRGPGGMQGGGAGGMGGRRAFPRAARQNFYHPYYF